MWDFSRSLTSMCSNVVHQVLIAIYDDFFLFLLWTEKSELKKILIEIYCKTVANQSQVSALRTGCEKDPFVVLRNRWNENSKDKFFQ